jgi:hypothetical protein
MLGYISEACEQATATSPASQPVDDRRTAHRFLSVGNEIGLKTMLRVVGEFEEFQHSSVELVAWELGSDPHLIGRLWSRALASGLLGATGIDPQSGDSTFSLTPAGWDAIARV